MSVAVEIVHLQSSEAFRNNHAIFEPVLGFAASAPGNLGAYYGFTEEDANEAYMIVVWETVEHHKALMNDPQIYPQMLAAASVCVVAPVRLYHVWLESGHAAASALNAPVTSISHVFGLEAGNAKEKWFSELSRKFASWQSTAQSGFDGGCFGKVLENDELTVICGWDWGAGRRVVDLLDAPIETDGSSVHTKTVATGKTVHMKLSAYKRYQVQGPGTESDATMSS